MRPIGIMLLDTKFPRPKGDIGHADSYDFPVIIATVPRASVQRVVVEADMSLLEPFIACGKELERQGCVAITTSCGFLAVMQRELAEALNVPVFSSSVMQISLIHHMTQKPIGIITANGNTLTPKHLKGAGAPAEAVYYIKGLEQRPAFRHYIFDEGDLDIPTIEQEVLAAADELREEHPDIGSILCECHNLAHYGPALHQHTQLPVFDIIHFAHWVHESMHKRSFMS